jgi:hypothetical protein
VQGSRHVIEQGCSRTVVARKLKVATVSEVRHQLLITLVHGTWPRGFFPRIIRFKQRVRELMRRRQPWDPPPFWFEEGSHFLARLSAELGDIPHKIKPLLWSGENSIFERDKTAHVLADYLSAEHLEDSRATQLIIAHSHGGNIALRALHHLQKRDASHACESETPDPFVITLATPFIEVHQANFGRRPSVIRMAIILVILFLLAALLVAALIVIAILTESLPEPYRYAFFPIFVLWALGGVAAFLYWGWWAWSWFNRTAARQKQLDALKDATQLASARRLLVVRAIDDEASLALALGAMFNYGAARSITFLVNLTGVLGIALSVDHWLLTWLPYWASAAIYGGFFALTIPLVGVLMASRSVHGRELAVSPMECQINTQSAPDAKGLSEIVTLVRRTYVKSLRHGIYDHEDCAKTISDWARSQLCSDAGHGPPS